MLFLRKLPWCIVRALLCAWLAFSPDRLFANEICDLTRALMRQKISDADGFLEFVRKISREASAEDVELLLKSSGVVLGEPRKIQHKGKTYLGITVAPTGNHPLNILARIFGKKGIPREGIEGDGFELVFAPEYLRAKDALGLVSPTERIVFLATESRGKGKARFGDSYLTFSDFHELLHAKLDRILESGNPGPLLIQAYFAGLAKSVNLKSGSYQKYFAFEEVAASMLELRLAFGRLKLLDQSNEGVRNGGLTNRIFRRGQWKEYIQTRGDILRNMAVAHRAVLEFNTAIRQLSAMGEMRLQQFLDGAAPSDHLTFNQDIATKHGDGTKTFRISIEVPKGAEGIESPGLTVHVRTTKDFPPEGEPGTQARIIFRRTVLQRAIEMLRQMRARCEEIDNLSILRPAEYMNIRWTPGSSPGDRLDRYYELVKKQYDELIRLSRAND